MTAPCRLLPLAQAFGSLNMALDEALLHSAVELGVPSLRFYAWKEPTLSLGYFQPFGAARAYPGLGSLAWLRRPSGGEALVHHHELTYALALPADRERHGSAPWLLRFHEIIADALADRGVRTRPCEAGEAVRRGEVLCFLHHTPGDLILDGHKVVGSAQRKVHGALLQHGGILLAQSPHTPALPGIAELTSQVLAPAELASALVRRFRKATGWDVSAASWTAAELRFAEEAVVGRYTAASWNEKR
jgi:lipoate-protein ligase A